MLISTSIRTARLLGRFFTGAFVCAFPLVLSAVDVPAPQTLAEAVEALEPTEAKAVGVMDLEGVDSEIASILRRYYERSFGGEENWKRIKSIRFSGTLRLPQGTLDFRAFKKKPNYCKILLRSPNGMEVIMAYDGQDAWQLNTALSPEPTAMPPKEALNFIRDADTGGHLLYPKLPGKTIELLGTRRVGEVLCYDLRVTLPDGQQITYAIDITRHEERQQILENAATGNQEVITHAANRRVAGVVVPSESRMTIDGEFVHEVQIDQVQVNRGVMPWMFTRPASTGQSEE